MPCFVTQIFIFQFLTVLKCDANNCTFEDNVELIQPHQFTTELEYIINASCDEEADGMVIIRTSGGNPPLYYTVNSSDSIYTTTDTLLFIYESNYHLGELVEEIELTESDVLATGFNGNSFKHRDDPDDPETEIAILNEEALANGYSNGDYTVLNSI